MKRRILTLLLCLLMTAALPAKVFAGTPANLVPPKPAASQNTKKSAENEEETGMAEDGSYRLPDAVVYVPYYIDLAEELRGESLYFESVDKLPSWLTLEEGILSGMPVFDEEKEDQTEETYRFKIRVYGKLPDCLTGTTSAIPAPSVPDAPETEPEQPPATEPEKVPATEPEKTPEDKITVYGDPDSDKPTFTGDIIARSDDGEIIASDPDTGRMVVVDSYARAAEVDRDSISIDSGTGEIILTDPHTERTLAIDPETGTVRTVDGSAAAETPTPGTEEAPGNEESSENSEISSRSGPDTSGGLRYLGGDYTVMEFVLRLKSNSDENVAKADVKGYEVIQPIPDMLEVQGPFDFISAGPFAEFEAVFLNGRGLRRDVDYAANEGSTVITLAEQTLQDAGKGSHTISATFRSRDGTNTLRTSSQNFLIGSLRSTVDYFSVSVAKSENGSLRANLSQAAKGTVVGLHAEPGKRSRLQSVTVKDAGGEEVSVTKKSDTEFSFVMPGGAVTASAVFSWELSDLGFNDVFPEDWFYEPVKWAVGEDITNGITPNSFGPYVDCSQAHILTFLWRAAGCPEPIIENPYPDLPDMYYVKPAIWAYEKGMASDFDPQSPCTRSEVVMYQWILAGRPNVSAAKFTDVPDSAPYARAVAWAIREGITKGVGNQSFAPDKSCNRAEIVTFLQRGSV